ncbi:hypothetical protein NMY22_g6986 [Coprinellus aureogranulatus]|nr:hypothetical protein NMY22_g6986 [Coprinellus aureogranulatus]
MVSDASSGPRRQGQLPPPPSGPPQTPVQTGHAQMDENGHAIHRQASFGSSPATSNTTSSSSSPTTFSQWEMSTSHISNDLRDFVVRQFQLSEDSQDDLDAVEDILQRVPAMPKALAISTFINTACQLRSYDFLVNHLGGQDAQELRGAIERLIEISDQDRPFSLTVPQQRSVRLYTNHASFDENLYETDQLGSRVFTFIEGRKAQLGFEFAFENASTVAGFRSALGTTATSIMGSWRVELIVSACPAYGETISLIQFIRDQFKKYTKGALNPVALKHGHVVRAVLMRAFILDCPKLMKIKGRAVKRQFEEIDREDPTFLKTPDGLQVPVPSRPGREYFWRNWNWWMECRKIEYGSDMNSMDWKVFILESLQDDMSKFKHPDTDACPHVQEVVNASLAGLCAAVGTVPAAMTVDNGNDLEEPVAPVDPIIEGPPVPAGHRTRRRQGNGGFAGNL